MSEKLCTLRTKGGGGGKYTETSLWTNSAPTSTFAGQSVTLSDSISNYKYVGIKFAYATNYSTGDCISTIILSVEDFKKGGYNTGVRRNNFSMSLSNVANTAYSRMVLYNDDNSVRFGTCYQVGTNTNANGNAIPLEILGLK